MSDAIDLSGIDVDGLQKLIGKAEKEIDRKRKTEVLELRNEFEQTSRSRLGMTLQEVVNFDGKKKKKSKTVGVPKYRNPENPEQTWTGRGKRPGWIRSAIESGVNIDEFLI